MLRGERPGLSSGSAFSAVAMQSLTCVLILSHQVMRYDGLSPGRTGGRCGSTK